MTTTFQKNSELNRAFGNARGDITAPDFKKIRNQAKLVLEETRELLEAAYFDHQVVLTLELNPRESETPTTTEDLMKAIMDAQGDITTVNDGVAHIAGFDGDECLQRVFASNMSKFIRSEDEVGPALDYYYSRGFPEGQLRVEGEFPRACIKVNETVTWQGKEYPAGKFLKNMASFFEPDFSDMLSGNPEYQINTIVSTSYIPMGQVLVSRENGIAYFHHTDLQGFLASCQEIPSEEIHVEGDTEVESYVPTYRLSVENNPDLNGLWAANTRVFVYSPYNPEVTQLRRID